MRVIEKAKLDEQLHKVSCNLQKIPGKIYYLYKAANRKLLFSILSPSEWGTLCHHEYLGAYRLEADKSWTPEEEFMNAEYRSKSFEKILQITR